MKETAQEMATRIEAEARAARMPEDRDYGLMIAGAIRNNLNKPNSKYPRDQPETPPPFDGIQNEHHILLDGPVQRPGRNTCRQSSGGLFFSPHTAQIHQKD